MPATVHTGAPPETSMDWLGLARTYWVTDRAGRALDVIGAAEQKGPGDVALADLRTDILRSLGERTGWERSGHHAHPPPGRRCRPAPYAVLPGFLDADLRRWLRRLVAAHADDFGASTVGSGRLDPQVRRSLRLRDTGAAAVVRRRIRPRIEAELPRLRALLDPGVLAAGSVECKITSCPPGSFFRAHRDDRLHEAPAAPSRRRVLSYVCWFHREPARFTGGDLFLHDTSEDGYDAVSGTRFIPTSGTLVVFPSGTYHSVLPVGGGEVDLVDTRLAVTGHVGDLR